jgi:hypothetical protein
LRNAPLSILALMLALPLFAFNLGFLTLAPGVAASVFLALGLGLFSRSLEPVKIDMAVLLVCLAAGFALVILGGQGHYFYATPDWWIRDAVLFDLITTSWPVSYATDAGVSLLRAPLGLYLAPALIGKIAGISAGFAALVAQDTLITGLILYGLIRQEAGAARWIVLAIFVGFSGVDVIPWLISLLRGNNIGMFLEGWANGFAYLSHAAQFFWAPHHSIAGWGFVAGFLAWRRGLMEAPALAALFALTLFWSPLSAMGAFPFLAWVCLDYVWKRRAVLFGALLRDIWAPALCGLAALPVFFFMTRDAGSVERKWIFTEPGFWWRYLATLAVEVAPYVIFILMERRARKEAWPDDRSKPAFALVIVLLLLFPLYSINFTNDFTMRASIPALALLSIQFGHEFARLIADGFTRQKWIVFVLMLSAMTPFVEVLRGIHLGVSPLPRCNYLDAWASGAWRDDPTNAYLADIRSFDSSIFQFRKPDAALRAGGPACAPGAGF